MSVFIFTQSSNYGRGTWSVYSTKWQEDVGEIVYNEDVGFNFEPDDQLRGFGGKGLAEITEFINELNNGCVTDEIYDERGNKVGEIKGKKFFANYTTLGLDKETLEDIVDIMDEGYGDI